MALVLLRNTLERYFARHPGMREKIFIQSKCTLIRDAEKTLYLDTSKEHILKSVDDSLKRLGTDYLDTYLLHHPDTLIEPEEVAEAFDILRASGKVRHFGVSNFKTMDLEFLQSFLDQKLIVNQMQLGVAHTEVIDANNSIKLNDEDNVEHNGSVLTYMRMKRMTLQAWSPFQVRFYGGILLKDASYPTLNQVVNRDGSGKGSIAGSDCNCVDTQTSCKNPANGRHYEPTAFKGYLQWM